MAVEIVDPCGDLAYLYGLLHGNAAFDSPAVIDHPSDVEIGTH
jgi:hypothetical protein